MNEDHIILEIKGNDDLMHSTQVTQLTWLMDRKVSQEAIIKFFEDTS